MRPCGEARRAAAVADSKVAAELLGLVVGSAPQSPAAAGAAAAAAAAASDADSDADAAADACEVERLRAMVEDTLRAAAASSSRAGASFPAGSSTSTFDFSLTSA